MLLHDLLGGIDVLERVGDTDVDVASVTHDSRRTRPGDLFCCIRGDVADGHRFAPDAVAAGAVALLVETILDLPVPQVRVSSVRRAIGPVAARVAGEPSRAMRVIGVTGTNGKTTTTHLLAEIARAAGEQADVLGTLTAERTTPEAPELQASLAAMRDAGVTTVAMEVSSHALAQHRVDGTRFAAVGVHEPQPGSPRLPRHPRRLLRGQGPALHTGLHRRGGGERRRPPRAPARHRRARRWVWPCAPSRSTPTPTCGSRTWSSTTTDPAARSSPPRAARPSASRCSAASTCENAAAAAALALAAGLPLRRRRARPRHRPGRCEAGWSASTSGQPFTVVVDYAHTPDALAHLLAAGARARGRRPGRRGRSGAAVTATGASAPRWAGWRARRPTWSS